MELKALVYDQLAQIEQFQTQIGQCQNNIKFINQEIATRKNQPPVEEAKK